MAKPVAERSKATLTPKVERKASLSMKHRSKRPLPATRAEADDLFRPSPAYGPQLASGARIARMQKLGIIPHYTNAEAHEAILNAMYGPDGLLIERDLV